MGTGVDNIEVDPHNGDLWVGCHLITWKVLDFLNIFNAIAPSQVFAIIATFLPFC